MGDSEHPKLVCTETGTVIDINFNPFSIGRGLSCNYVIVKKPVSRVHCVLEKNDDVWILRDTSTNGSLVNDTLHKGIKSAPLKDGDIIKFYQEAESYVFRMGRRNASDDISDEQLCSIADSVLNEVEAFEQETRNQDNNRQFPCDNISEDVDMEDRVSMANAALQDHLSMAKPINTHLSKKQKTQVEPTEAATTANASSVNLKKGGAPTANVTAGTSNAASTSHLVDLTASSDNSSASVLPEREQPSASSIEGPSEVTSTSETSVQPPRAVVDHQDTYEVMENELQCAICSELFVKAVTLQCSHTFCKYCIELWKKTKSECPICRKKITGMTLTLVLDNVIEKVMESSSEETRQHRNKMIEERRALENAKPPPPKQVATRGRGRGRRGRGATRGRGGMRSNSPAFVSGVVGNAVQRDSVPQHVIEVSSDSNSDWDDYTDSNSDDTAEWQDEYDMDDWYDGVPGNYYGGYGHCYCCGRQGHWANGCPFR